MALPITITYTFATATSPIPLNKLDADFSLLTTTINGIGSGSVPLATPVLQGGSLTGTLTNSGTISGGAVNPATIQTTGAITAGTTLSASGTITSSSSIQGTAITATTGNITATAGSVSGTSISATSGDVTASGLVKAGGSYPQLEYTSGYSNLNYSSTAGFSYNGSGQIDMSVGGTSQLHFNSSEFSCSVTPKANQVAWSLISDAREKTNISSLSLSTQRIMKLNPVSFTWIKDGKEDSGFIAQEFETVYPQNVQEIDNRKHIGLNMNFYADLIATIQELRTELDALKAKVGA